MPLTTQKRLVIWQIVMQILRKAHSNNFPGRAFGHDLHLTLTFGAVVILTSEGFPARVSKISAYLELPRETTRRHLDALVHLGLIRKSGREYELTPKVVVRHINDLAAFIRTAATKL